MVGQEEFLDVGNAINQNCAHQDVEISVRALSFPPNILSYPCNRPGCLSGLVVRVHGYKSRGPGSISGATRFS
jgi:hypothetical protein